MYIYHIKIAKCVSKYISKYFFIDLCDLVCITIHGMHSNIIYAIFGSVILFLAIKKLKNVDFHPYMQEMISDWNKLKIEKI